MILWEENIMKNSKKIQDIHAIEVLDSRGNPTIQVEVILEDGSTRNESCSVRCFYWKL